METYDWSKFDIYFYINSSVDKIFDKWATASGLESFFMKKVDYESKNDETRDKNIHVRAGDRYTWEFYYGSIIEGEIIEVEQNKKVSFTFGDSIVDVLLTGSNKRTLIHLCQRNIPLSEEAKIHVHLNCRGAWIHFLTVLKSVLEFNVDCRDKELLTAGSISTRFFPEEYSN